MERHIAPLLSQEPTDMPTPEELDRSSLPPGATRGELEIQGVLYADDVAIYYAAADRATRQELMLQEYMPAGLAVRSAQGHVQLRSSAATDSFHAGLMSFVLSARVSAGVSHPCLLGVVQFWEEGGTAYLSTPLRKGKPLGDVLGAGGSSPISEAWLRALLVPVLGALGAMHAQGLVHRAVCPEHIFLDELGQPSLRYLFAARRFVGDRPVAVALAFNPGYSPIEQAADVSALRQGPWSDIYALGATLHFALTGLPPPSATQRVLKDEYVPLSSRQVPRCSVEFLDVVDQMLVVDPARRVQSVSALRELLGTTARRPVASERLAAQEPGQPVGRLMSLWNQFRSRK